MKILLLLCTAAVFGRFTSAQVLSEPVQRPTINSARLKLAAEMEAVQVKTGTAIVIKLRLKNVTSRAVLIGHSDVIIDYEFTVTNANGKEAARTELGNRLLRGDISIFRAEGINLGMGEETEESLDLRKIYQLTSPGIYYVRAAHRNIFPEKSADGSPGAPNNQPIEKAFSSPLQFTIVP